MLGRARLRADLAGELTAELSGSLNLRRTRLRIFGLLQPRFAEWVMLALPDGRPGGVVLHGGTDARVTSTATLDPDQDSGLGRVLRTGVTALFRSATDAELDQTVPHPALRAAAAGLFPADVLALALVARGATIGALVVLRGPGRRFEAEDVALAEQIAGRAAMALDSARIYEERSHVASVLQAGLRPPTLPSIPDARVSARFRAAAEHMEIGGDFYDVHGSGDDWLLTLGDVCGKGVEAAVLTGRTRQSIRTAAYFDRSPAKVLEALNSVLYDADSERFVTVVCARLRPEPGGEHATVDLAVAGHPSPLIVRAGGEVEQVEITGMATGILPGVRYKEVSVRIQRGDTLLMFTDGVDEARGEDGYYGMDRLLRLLSAYAGAGPEIVCEAVEQDVVEYLDGRTHDDIALLALACGR
ncbi:PP2C family protein-serine/threonine phosphatase [Amycolatopsis sp. H20-H5]|uniref:PP2C family protein-serine/threonine phosphatase n=1 Tax=Amycolatopsis sp. H20-H5 TaxID=3046309 RepID=UPI002DB78B57|nr:GAF domain-containing SpoIIE family protein phosphatase [Amycolatopsis sp. H20-H5]MEC3982577.1 GAF domain-containing SpoIIE family protein phosphatase [Amycolatopsis sp. H20-H5]